MSEASLDGNTDLWSGGVKPFTMNSKKFGMWLFIAADSITFAALLFAYSYARLVSTDWTTPFNFSSIVLSSTMTFCLLSSSLTMVLAVSASAKGDRKKTFLWILATMGGGIAFTALHLYEWTHIWGHHVAPVLAANKPLPMIWATFYGCTGMHMLHVSIGVGYLAIVGFQYPGGKFKAIDVEVLGLYWHFVDLVWMFVFPLIYLLSTRI